VPFVANVVALVVVAVGAFLAYRGLAMAGRRARVS
jgi:hypothetical protein